jgi:hypothetical protein
MKKTIIEIEQLAAFVFEDEKYQKFLIFIQNKMYNDARLMLDKEILDQNQWSFFMEISFETAMSNRIVDLLIDLIEIDVDADERRIVKSIAREQ